MPEEQPTIRNANELAERLSEILIDGSLYRNFNYRGERCHFTNTTTVIRTRFGQLPKQLRMYCDHEKCAALTWWDVEQQIAFFDTEFIKQRYYTCRNCGVQRQYDQLSWQGERRHRL